MSSITAPFLNVFAAPDELFRDQLQSRKAGWLALVILLLMTSGSILYFYGGMSPEWIVEQQMLQTPEQSPAEDKQVRQFLTEQAPYTGTLGAIFNAIFYMIILAVFAAYFKFAGRSNEQQTYGDWFNFAIWTQMPMLVHIVGFLALVVTANTPDLPIMLANYSSLNQLVLDLPMSHNMYTWAETINLFYLWSIFIAAKGLMNWCKMSATAATIYSAVPYVVVFGLWAMFSL